MFTTGILCDLIYGIFTGCFPYRRFIARFRCEVLIPYLRAVGLAFVEQIADLAACELCRGLALDVGDGAAFISSDSIFVAFFAVKVAV